VAAKDTIDMDNRWNASDAASYDGDLLGLRAYSSRLLGSDQDLVLHGGGNTSVKAQVPDIHGEPESVLYVKGSGWDLGSIQPAGFAPLRMQPVRRLTELRELSDAGMMRALRAASTEPDAPAPSVETITHAIIPHRFVDHTHSDHIVTISNTPDGEDRVRKLYGDRVLIVPYAMPGFVLAKLVHQVTEGADWDKLDGVILMNHGVFTFDDDAKASYDRMIELVAMAEAELGSAPTRSISLPPAPPLDLPKLSRLRKAVAVAAGTPMLASLDGSPEARAFSSREDSLELGERGCLTPDHVLHAKPRPMLIGDDPEADVAGFAVAYAAYFDRNAADELTQLDGAPRWAIWPGHGLVAFGINAGRAQIVQDIVRHGTRAAQRAEALSRWQPVGEKDLFDVEYWELEQAKLKRGGAPPPLQGKVAVVTGGASGIGRACVEELRSKGAAVAALDLNDDVVELVAGAGYLGIRCDVTDSTAVDDAIGATVARFGGIDLLIANAGTFPATRTIEEMDDAMWASSIDVNLTGHMRLLRSAAPFLRQGIDPAVVVIASKNVPAPGPGAAAYSAAKAGLTQMARVAAFELGKHGIRVNILHPNAVFDTGIWTDEVLGARAAEYGLTVEQYKRNNVLGVEVTSADVASLAAALASPLFAKTTGAQIPVDGGNDRVI
jgi:rhamnose utilization protein RhaD (predicted bifunctional aldolase and dehydrogenase)/NAD(P)-dependent dehydrogenase (short-subunit alcohol dehydrogenase family)